MNSLPNTVTIDGIEATVGPMWHYYQAKRELDALKEEHPEVAELLFYENNRDDNGNKSDEYYETEDLLDAASIKVWWVARLARQQGILACDWAIIMQDAASYNLTWDGQYFVA